MLATRFSRSAAAGIRVRAQSIVGDEWFCTDRNGLGAIMTTGAGSSPRPPDFLLMALGACTGNGINVLLRKKRIPFKTVTVDVEGDWAEKPQIRFSDIRLLVKSDAEISKEELKKLADKVVESLCPVGGTLAIPPNISTSIV
jgi:uncharacterized OsmC-like protein